METPLVGFSACGTFMLINGVRGLHAILAAPSVVVRLEDTNAYIIRPRSNLL